MMVVLVWIREGNLYRGSKGKASVKPKVLSLDKKDKGQIKENIESVWVRLPPKGIKHSVENKEEALGFKRKTSGTMLSVSQEMVWGGGILQVSMDNRRPLLDMNLGVY